MSPEQLASVRCPVLIIQVSVREQPFHVCIELNHLAGGAQSNTPDGVCAPAPSSTHQRAKRRATVQRQGSVP